MTRKHLTKSAPTKSENSNVLQCAVVYNGNDRANIKTQANEQSHFHGSFAEIPVQTATPTIQLQKIGGESISNFGIHQSNKAGLPNALKARIENLSHIPMDDVKVHYNSPKPAQLQALAYTQGANIYLGYGQEKYLSHEAWHVVQQKQGRVKPTLQTKGMEINNEPTLEEEADAVANQLGHQKVSSNQLKSSHQLNTNISTTAPIQCVKKTEINAIKIKIKNKNKEYGKLYDKPEVYKEIIRITSGNNNNELWISLEQKLGSDLENKNADEVSKLYVDKLYGIESSNSSKEEVEYDQEKEVIINTIFSTIEAEKSSKKTHAYTTYIKKKLNLTKGDINSIIRFSKEYLQTIHSQGLEDQKLWKERNKFTDTKSGDSTYKTYVAPLQIVADEQYEAFENELDMWNDFLSRPLYTGKIDLIFKLQNKIKSIEAKFQQQAKSDKLNIFELVNTNSLLKAERMKMSNTVYKDQRNEQLIKEGKGQKVAELSLTGKQWQNAEENMLMQASKAFQSKKVEITPQQILDMNEIEGSETGISMFQPLGEIRWGQVDLGVKNKDKEATGEILRLLPPNIVGKKLADLINETNARLRDIKTAENNWKVIPIVARFYTDFISIHPFPDGNGRTARRVVDFILMSYGLPPAQFDVMTKNYGAGVLTKNRKAIDIKRVLNENEAVEELLKALEKALDTIMRTNISDISSPKISVRDQIKKIESKLSQ
jgi:Fic/DOC family/Domain of unknown function (DUF4157)